MPQPIVHVDAFTDTPFRGNPAAVCILDGPAPEDWMQSVALEMNLSETAFLHPIEDGFTLRWVTPTVEVDLCGHATLASAHVLWQDGRLAPDAMARFHTKSGLLTAQRAGDWIELDFPATPAEACDAPPALIEALGAAPSWVGRNQFDYLVELASETAVRGLRPDFARLCRLPVRGVMATARADSPEFDFVSRFFAPASGINEDPVTGSAHCTLGPFWGERLGKTEMAAYQASKRGGVVRLRLDGERVKLAGQAVTTLRGELV
jgi:PhzF family phenazine biosynthesis protein